LSLGDDLLAKLKRRNLVEDVGDRERSGADVRQLSGRTQVILLVGIGIVARLLAHRVHQLLAGGEMAVHRSASQACLAGNRPHARIGVRGEQTSSRIEDLRSVQGCVAALTALRGILSDLCGFRVTVTKWNRLTHLYLISQIRRISLFR
jgi:hypothetical protein